MRVDLIRVDESDKGTFGVLKIDGVAFCVTLEPPWNKNKKNISSIPKGVYSCKKITSIRYGETFEVQGVPNRSNVLFHAGNVTRNTKGCILLAQYFGKLSGNRAVLNSGKTFKEFLNVLKNYNFFALNIIEV